MGRLDVKRGATAEEVRTFTKALLDELRALEEMLAAGTIESGERRIGVEQEMFLVDRGWRPAPVAMQVLEGLLEEPYTTELVRFQLEINDAPVDLRGPCLSGLERGLEERVGAVREQAHRQQAEVVLTGILPTLTMSDLDLENMCPIERYYALNEVLSSIGGGCYRLHIQGSDELHLEYDSVMLEGCNSSFQVHLQVDGEEFARVYNAAQLVTAPVLSASVNSPLLFGKRLWAETRISLFQQSIDTRGASRHLRQLAPRVRFGERWVRGSVLEVYREDVARFPALLTCGVDEDALAMVRSGGAPRLRALQLYNGTVYRWNRPCYGVLDGQPQLRIECRVLPSGPTVADEVANAALWAGAVLGVSERYGDIAELIPFAEARSNLIAAARHGLRASFSWLDGRSGGARELILEELLPLARDGLASAGVDAGDIDRYLGIVEARVASGGTGADWLERSLAGLDPKAPGPEKMAVLVAATVERQLEGRPGHEWPLADAAAVKDWHANYLRVEQYMTTDLFTIKEDELIDLAALVMDWKGIRQLPVEDERRRLVGVVSFGSVLRLLANGERASQNGGVPVRQVMWPHPPTVPPEASTLEAMRLMREHGVTSLPVVKNDELVGIVSITDFLPLAERLLLERLEP